MLGVILLRVYLDYFLLEVELEWRQYQIKALSFAMILDIMLNELDFTKDGKK